MEISRESILKKHISLNLLYKIIGIIFNYLSIPIILNYLGEEKYGIWITIFTTLTWIYNFDMGLGNGLRNKLTMALTNKNYDLAKEYISTSYFLISVISLIVFIVIYLYMRIINLSKVLNVTTISEIELKKFVLICLLYVLVNFVLKLYAHLYYAIHDSSKKELGNIIYQVIVLILVYLFNYFRIGNRLIGLGLINLIAVLISGLVFTVIFFRDNKTLLPSIKYISLSRLKQILGVSMDFFLIQISMLVILSTDNIIITKLLGPTHTTPYNLVSKLFMFYSVIFSIILRPFWGLYTDAYLKRDVTWIKDSLKKLNLLYIVLLLCIAITVLLANGIMKLWLGRELYYPKYLILMFGLFTIIRTYSDIYMHFVNGIGKTRVQTILFIIGAIVNIPLSILLVKFFRSSTGVILATNICMISFIIILPIQTKYILDSLYKEIINKY